MRFTSSEANKYLRQLNDQKCMLCVDEKQNSTFVAATVENIEDVRPEYDLEETQKQLMEINGKIRKVKHALNLFNAQTVVDGFDMTIDEMLVYLPQLTQRIDALNGLATEPAKERRDSRVSINLIEYKYANYDVQKARELYNGLVELQHRAQTALDLVNSTVKFEVEV